MKVEYLKLSCGLIMLFKAVISGRFLDQKFLRVVGIQTEMHLAQYFPQAGNCSILCDAVRCKANSTRHNLIKNQRLLVIESRERNKISNKMDILKFFNLVSRTVNIRVISHKDVVFISISRVRKKKFPVSES